MEPRLEDEGVRVRCGQRAARSLALHGAAEQPRVFDPLPAVHGLAVDVSMRYAFK